MPDHPEAGRMLRKALSDLDEVFGRYRGDAHWDDALDNLSKEQSIRPAEVPGKELSWAEVEYFFSHGVCLHGPRGRDRNDLKAIRYFLPRVFEYHSLDIPPEAVVGYVCDWWFVGELMRNARWHLWPAKECGPIKSWFRAWLEAILLYQNDSLPCQRSTPPNRRMHNWLDAAAELDLATEQFVPALGSAGHEQVLELVSTLIDRHFSAQKAKCRGFLWETDDPSRQRPLASWLLDAGTMDRLVQIFFTCTDPERAQRVSNIVDLLQAMIGATARSGR